ncbi:hypothetical protein BANRA_05320 [Klebsiella variicola]|nr:hypothetical protein BANRA_05320 [Klebsiella variicola]
MQLFMVQLYVKYGVLFMILNAKNSSDDKYWNGNNA